MVEAIGEGRTDELILQTKFDSATIPSGNCSRGLYEPIVVCFGLLSSLYAHCGNRQIV